MRPKNKSSIHKDKRDREHVDAVVGRIDPESVRFDFFRRDLELPRTGAGPFPEVPQFPIAFGARRRAHRPEQQHRARERREQAPAQRRGSRHRAPFFLSLAWHP
jgi:hypothetical protein